MKDNLPYSPFPWDVHDDDDGLVCDEKMLVLRSCRARDKDCLFLARKRDLFHFVCRGNCVGAWRIDDDDRVDICDMSITDVSFFNNIMVASSIDRPSAAIITMVVIARRLIILYLHVLVALLALLILL